MFLPRHCIAAVFLLALPALVQAQFVFTTNNGAITITGYNGPGGVVVIPDTTNGYPVIGISDFAFEDGTNLTSVTIPGTVTNIGEAPFLGCSSLTNISVSTTNPVYLSENGVLIDYQNYTLDQYPNGLTNETYTLPVGYPTIGVTNVGSYAFASCASLRSVKYSSVNGWYIYSIGDFAFSGCTGLTSVTISNVSNMISGRYAPTSIGTEAFSYCTSLNNIVFITPVADIGGLAFAYCSNLTAAYFPGNGSPDVGNAFYGDPEAVVYYMPGTTNWGPMFEGAPTAEQSPPYEFNYGVINGSIIIGSYTGPAPGAVIIPAYINGYPVTSIVNAFRQRGITSVIIPNTVTNIGESTFEQCSSLTNIVIPDSVTSIDAFAFELCTRLTGVIIPGSVTSIGQDAFTACTSLRSAYFEGNAPPDLGNAFSGCPATVYYLPGTTGWGSTWGGVPAVLWNPQATAFTTAGNQFGFNITGPTNATIVVEACTNLANPVWLPVSTTTLSGSGTSSFSDPQSANYPNRYYRFSAP
ncbi:MAG TPA: leucine-rich repeat domain-containing protein [Alphaproteobacteria bacterium]|nr:leucine-rich repeat domain-containing protein [Alphaproteobacteria bacterium]